MDAEISIGLTAPEAAPCNQSGAFLLKRALILRPIFRTQSTAGSSHNRLRARQVRAFLSRVGLGGAPACPPGTPRPPPTHRHTSRDSSLPKRSRGAAAE